MQPNPPIPYGLRDAKNFVDGLFAAPPCRRWRGTSPRSPRPARRPGPAGAATSRSADTARGNLGPLGTFSPQGVSRFAYLGGS